MDGPGSDGAPANAAGSTVQAQAQAKMVNLALQGGGAHGAFAWGVLDFLLEDGRLAFEGISATSAGAINAVICGCGLLKGGREGARQALREFWRGVADAGAIYAPLRAFFGTALFNHLDMQALAFMSAASVPPFVSEFLKLNPCLRWMAGCSDEFQRIGRRSFASPLLDAWTSFLSPYYFNPVNLNPLKRLLEAHVDFATLRAAEEAVRLHICATNVETGKIRIFRNCDLTPETILASTCLPFVFQAVEVKGEYFWDGGYIGNPAIFPLIYDSQSRDVIIVHIDPILRKGCPRTTLEIMNRLNEVSFNSSLMREMRAIAFVTRLIESGKIKDGEIKHVLMHAVRAEDAMTELGPFSRTQTDWAFLEMLFHAGRKAAATWLEKNFADIGRVSTIDLDAEYL